MNTRMPPLPHFSHTELHGAYHPPFLYQKNPQVVPFPPKKPRHIFFTKITPNLYYFLPTPALPPPPTAAPFFLTKKTPICTIFFKARKPPW